MAFHHVPAPAGAALVASAVAPATAATVGGVVEGSVFIAIDDLFTLPDGVTFTPTFSTDTETTRTDDSFTTAGWLLLGGLGALAALRRRRPSGLCG